MDKAQVIAAGIKPLVVMPIFISVILDTSFTPVLNIYWHSRSETYVTMYCVTKLENQGPQHNNFVRWNCGNAFKQSVNTQKKQAVS